MTFKLKNAFCFCLVVFTFSACDNDLFRPVSTVNLDNRLKLFMKEGMELMEDLEKESADLTSVEGYSKRLLELFRSNVYDFYVPGKDVLKSVEDCQRKVESVTSSSGPAEREKLEALQKLLNGVIGTMKQYRERWDEGKGETASAT